MSGHSERKISLYTKIQQYICKYKNLIVCDIKNLPANIIHKLRKQLREIDTEAICGKSTVMMKAIKDLAENKPPKNISKETLLKLAKNIEHLQIMLFFTNQDLSKITQLTGQYNIEKFAKSGQISPIEVIIPAGSSGLDSSKVDLFQALKITTKVIKNQLEIMSNSKILSVGSKIGIPEINLMKQFNIKPFKHQILIEHIILNGKMYDKGILKITDDYMKDKLEKGLKNIAAFGIATNIPNKISAPIILSKAFSNICGLSLATNVLIPQTKNLKAQPVKKVEPKKEEKKAPKKEEPKKEEEEDDDLGLGLF